jgi:hypothetical protein
LRTDFVAETALFLQQGKYLADLNPDTTLYTVQFGMSTSLFGFLSLTVLGQESSELRC